jgi:hypothetical protein
MAQPPDAEDADLAAKLPVPAVSEELIRWLRVTNPIRSLGRKEDLRDADRAAGLQALIDKLHFFSMLQAKFEAGDFESDEERNAAGEMLVWEAPTKEQEENGFVLRLT